MTLQGEASRCVARYVVGCYGGHSRVRELAGIGFPGTSDEEEFQAAFVRVFDRDLPLGKLIWLSSTVAQARLADRYRADRVFVAGDAAHLFPQAARRSTSA